jgi:hypothetical protein
LNRALHVRPFLSARREHYAIVLSLLDYFLLEDPQVWLTALLPRFPEI